MFGTKADSSIKYVEESVIDIRRSLESLSGSNDSSLSDLEERVRKMAERLEVALPESVEADRPAVAETADVAVGEAEENRKKSKPGEWRDADVALTCIAGGIAVLLDFLVVKIPKTSTIVRNKERITQEGSPLTGLMRGIGFDKDGNTSPWVKSLEKFFGVPFDKSVIKGEKGFGPRSHRVYSLAHDPSPSGFLWAMKDLLCGTTSYIDSNGLLKMIASKPASLDAKLVAPIMWIGHILSDVFTKAGVPIPGSSLLRTLQFGSFGEKKRTIGQVVEYMYLEGYDLRHLATMATCNAAIEVVVRIYHALTKERIEEFARPGAVVYAEKKSVEHRLQKMRLGAYAVASCGNLSKLAVYRWNPNALNLPVWTELLRTALKEYGYAHGDEKLVCDVVASRAELEEGFEELYRKMEELRRPR